MAKKKVAILGSTGSIGTQALDVIARHRDRFDVVALAAGKQIDKLREQAAQFDVPIATNTQDGAAGLLRVAVESEPDIVLAATDGFVSFDAVFAAVERGIDIAVANKELIVAAGELLIAAARRSGAKLLPVDSEHSAVFQCLVGEDPGRVQSIIVTASGGPFWRKSAREMSDATVEAALAHPTWRMGIKNTVDSASMMNKGLEVIEASRLFGQPGERVQILVHPQSIAHGMVVFTDGSVKMQAAAPDMRLPIGYALAYPDRLTRPLDFVRGPSKPQDDKSKNGDPLVALGAHPDAQSLRYDFERPDPDRFPCVRLAYEALKAGGTMPAVLSAANEIAVEAFVEGEIRFGEIPAVIETTMSGASAEELSLDGVRRADRDARERARETVARLRCKQEV
ncbi:MAG TPA: 1-deoxy-D-xylulose-5-phosphate reductoisomerase [Candidatus Baltobacteraceae bacterium]|nr:1-deoxy-D-xylulose-5-phosphate reductoisomerase [Candidatus Baltobacteraceae bacterium]